MIPYVVTVESQYSAHLADKLFFDTYPRRSFLARKFAECDSSVPSCIVLFADNGKGELAELNITIVKRVDGGRKRIMLASNIVNLPNNDREIDSFLRSRNIDPNAFSHRVTR